jgi:hypothetical protein
VVRVNAYSSQRKSYLNFFVPPWKIGNQLRRNARRNIARFIRSDFHMDAGLGNLICAFYRAVDGKQDLPIPYREILLVSRVMDEIFEQVSPGRAANRG